MIVGPMADSTTDAVEVSTEAGVVMGRITAHAVEEREATVILVAVKQAIEQAGDGLRCVVLDFAEVNFINSSGLAACIQLRNEANAQGAQTIVYRPKDEVNQVFKMVRVDRLYTFAYNAQELQELVT